MAQLSTFFGILAALLASIGIYGVIAYNVAQRTGEFGIRMAPGAGRRQVLWLVMSEALRLALIGVGVGLALTQASGSMIQGLLFGIRFDDARILTASVAAMLIVALLAGYVPARRATRVDPTIALK